MKKVKKPSMIIWTLESFQFFIIRFAVLSAIFYFLNDYDLIKRITLLAIMYYTIILVIKLISHPLRYRNCRYLIDDTVIRINDGGFIISKDVIPIHRVQHVSIEQSFYSRFFGLYSLNAYTAGLDHCIEYLSMAEAESIKSHITVLIVNEETD